MTKSIKTLLNKIFRKLAVKFYSVSPRCPMATAQAKIGQVHLYNFYKKSLAEGFRFDLTEVGYRVYSQFEEDGLLAYIFAGIGTTNRTFIDIGAGNGIMSNVANLAINFGWRGLLIDGDEQNEKTANNFYSRHPDTALYPPVFVRAFVQADNINKIIADSGYSGEIDLISIDIDGNDYYVWESLSVVSPRVVIIETHTEFGMNNIVVPYNKDYCYPGRHPDYHGASPVAMVGLAKRKGYRLIGSNNYGFNTIYMKNGVGEDLFPEILVEQVLMHPRNAVRAKLFEPIKSWEYFRPDAESRS